jgi:CRP-like cAMP-binding protein
MPDTEEIKHLKEVIRDEVLHVLRNVTILSGFDEQEILRIFNDCQIIEKKPGEVLIEEGMPAAEIYVILQGKVGIVLDMKADPIELAEFGPGACIGEASVIGVQNHSASVVAKTICEFLVLTRAMLMDIYDRDKSAFSMLVLNIARELARRLYKTDQVLLHYGKKKDH